jgi:hypothetical protein
MLLHCDSVVSDWAKTRSRRVPPGSPGSGRRVNPFHAERGPLANCELEVPAVVAQVFAATRSRLVVPAVADWGDAGTDG